jgi:hypothetical protein
MHSTGWSETSSEFINADLVLAEFDFGDNPETVINGRHLQDHAVSLERAES